jgi:hypothetical protein
MSKAKRKRRLRGLGESLDEQAFWECACEVRKIKNLIRSKATKESIRKRLKAIERGCWRS